MHESFYTSAMGSNGPTYWSNAARLFNTEMIYPTQGGVYRHDAMLARILPWQDCVTGDNGTLWRAYYDGFRAMESRAIKHHNEYVDRQAIIRKRFKDNINSANAIARYSPVNHYTYHKVGREIGQALGAQLHRARRVRRS